MAKGAVFHHSQFPFHDGEIGDKYFVVLNDPETDETYVVAKTTSNLRNRAYATGCNPKFGVFYISQGTEKTFLIDTLIQLVELYEFSQKEVLEAHLKHKTITFRDDLTVTTVSQLINCIRKLKDDISEYHFKLITR